MRQHGGGRQRLTGSGQPCPVVRSAEDVLTLSLRAVFSRVEFYQRSLINYGYVVVSTYIDTGKSGVSIRSRDGLRKLLNDVVTGSALQNHTCF
jgi:DNA invertase Pin-like site-specific DNA recombinase